MEGFEEERKNAQVDNSSRGAGLRAGTILFLVVCCHESLPLCVCSRITHPGHSTAVVVGRVFSVQLGLSLLTNAARPGTLSSAFVRSWWGAESTSPLSRFLKLWCLLLTAEIPREGCWWGGPPHAGHLCHRRATIQRAGGDG